MQLVGQDRNKAIVAMIAVAFSYALFGPLIRLLANDFALFQQIYLRTGFAAVIGALFWGKGLYRNLPQAFSGYEFRLIAMRAACLTLGGTGFFTFAVLKAPLSLVAFLSALPSAVLWECLLFHTYPTKVQSFGLIIGLFGVLFILQPSAEISDINQLMGLCAALVSGIVFSFGLAARRLHRFAWRERELALLIMLFGTIETAIVSIVVGEGNPAVRLGNHLVIFFLIGGIIALSARLSSYAFARISGNEAGVIMMSEIPYAVLLGFVLYQEAPNVMQACGGVCVLIAGLLVTLYGNSAGEKNGITVA